MDIRVADEGTLQEEAGFEKRIHITSGEGGAALETEQPESKKNETGRPLDDWLPITQSRNGNSWTATFHLVCSGIGIQTLSLPLAFVYLGWVWGSVCLGVAYVWQLYTFGLLVNLHETVPGTRHSRYLQLSMAAFGEKLGRILAIFPVMYLSGGTCVLFIISGGGTMKLFYQLMCDNCSSKHPLTTTEWLLVFTCLAILVSLLFPNLHSLASVSFLGAIMAVGYCTILWVFFVAKGRIKNNVYDPSEAVTSKVGRARSILSAIGVIALAFRGHNVMLEIQGTMPSTPNHSSSKFMWKGLMASYLIIAVCFFPFAIVGYWAFGNKIPANEGLLTALKISHRYHMSKPVLGLVYIQVIISCVTAFQIYAIVVYDNLEHTLASRANKKCPKLTHIGIKIFFGGLTFFISVAFPFLPSLAVIIGGLSLPLTFGYPCLMWLSIRKPPKKSKRWWLNLGLGCLGIVLSLSVTVGAVWNLASRGLDANFFHPR